jgi:sialate O-acetylesterase
MNFQLNGWARGAFIMAWLFGFACDLKAEVSVPAFFSDHMMLQAGAPAPVWGRADPGEEVTVAFSGRTRSAKANAAGGMEGHI